MGSKPNRKQRCHPSRKQVKPYHLNLKLVNLVDNVWLCVWTPHGCRIITWIWWMLHAFNSLNTDTKTITKSNNFYMMLKMNQEVAEDMTSSESTFSCLKCLTRATCNRLLSFSHWSTICPELIKSPSLHHNRSIVVYGNHTAHVFFLRTTSPGLCNNHNIFIGLIL